MRGGSASRCLTTMLSTVCPRLRHLAALRNGAEGTVHGVGTPTRQPSTYERVRSTTPWYRPSHSEPSMPRDVSAHRSSQASWALSAWNLAGLGLPHMGRYALKPWASRTVARRSCRSNPRSPHTPCRWGSRGCHQGRTAAASSGSRELRKGPPHRSRRRRSDGRCA